MSEGWVCPKCGNVYAPWYPECTDCKGQKFMEKANSSGSAMRMPMPETWYVEGDERPQHPDHKTSEWDKPRPEPHYDEWRRPVYPLFMYPRLSGIAPETMTLEYPSRKPPAMMDCSVLS